MCTPEGACALYCTVWTEAHRAVRSECMCRAASFEQTLSFTTGWIHPRRGVPYSHRVLVSDRRSVKYGGCFCSPQISFCSRTMKTNKKGFSRPSCGQYNHAPTLAAPGPTNFPNYQWAKPGRVREGGAGTKRCTQRPPPHTNHTVSSSHKSHAKERRPDPELRATATRQNQTPAPIASLIKQGPTEGPTGTALIRRPRPHCLHRCCLLSCLGPHTSSYKLTSGTGLVHSLSGSVPGFSSNSLSAYSSWGTHAVSDLSQTNNSS